MGLFNGILRSQNQSGRPEEEAIQTLGNRLQHATLSADRKSAVLGLKSFSRSYRESVIQHGLRGLLSTLEKDVDNAQLVKAVLETLLILFLRVVNANEDQTMGWISTQSRIRNGKYQSPLLVEEIEIDEFSNWIADELISTDTHIQALMQILQQHEGFQVKIYALQLLEAVVATRPVRAKECVINIPLAVSTIVKQLEDINDPIRNESILLLMALSNDNFNIQKLVAFENTFGIIFDIIEEEGGIRGSILVQDCMTLLTNLLLYNASNQKFFLETDCVPKLAKLIAEPLGSLLENTTDELGDLPSQPIVWTDQRLDNMSIALEICRSFVNPDNQSLQQNQEKLQSSGIFFSILQLVFSPYMENPIRKTALLVTGDIIANNAALQLQFSQIDVPYIDPSFPSQIQNYKKPIPAPLALLNWAILTNSVHIFDVRLAAMHCLKSFLKGNPDAKMAFLSDQLKASKNPLYYEQLGLPEERKDEISSEEAKADAPSEDLDPNLKSAPYANIFSTLVVYNFDNKLNPYSVWFAAVTFVYLMEDCPETKTLAREFTVGDASEGEEEMTSIQAIAGMLVANLENADPRIASGYLILLTLWLYEDFDAVNDFLKDSTNIKSIVGFLSKNSTESSELVHGMCTILVGICYEFCSASSSISRSNLYELITKALGPDNYTLKVKQFKDSAIFKKFDELSDTQLERDSTGLPMLFFIPEYVELVKDNFYRIRRALFRGPEFEPRSRITFEVFEELENKSNELKKSLEELHEEAKAKELKLNEKIESDQKELQETAELLSKCNAELATTRAAEEELSAEVEKFAETLKALEKEKAELENSSKHYSVEYHKLLKKSGSDDETVKSLKQKLASTEEAKKKAEDGINKMSRELFQLSKQKDESDHKIQTLEKDLASQRTEYERRLKEVSASFESTKRANEELKAKIRVIESQSNNLGHSSSNDASAERLRQLQLKVSEAEGENDTLMEKLRSAATVVSELRKENTDLSQSREALQVELASAYEDIENLSKLLEEVNEMKSDGKETSQHGSDEELAALKVSLRSALEEKLAIEESLKQATKQLESLQSSHAEQSVAGAKDEGSAFTEQASKDEHAIVEDLTSKLREKDSELAICAQRIENFERNIELLSESANSSLNSFQSSQAALKDRVEKLEAIKENLQDEIRTMTQKHEADLQERQDAYDELESTYVDLELSFANVEKNKEDLELKLRKQEGESAEQITSLTAKLASVNEELELLKKAKMSAEHDLLELEKSTNIIGSELQAKDALLQALNNKGGDLAVKDKIVIEMKERLAQVIAELGDSAQKVKVMSKEISDQKVTVEQLHSDLESSSQKITVLEQEIAKKTEELEICVNEKRKLSSIQKNFIDLSDVNNANLKKISTLEAEVAALKKTMSEVSASYEAQQKSDLNDSEVAVSDYAIKTSKLEKSILESQQQHDAAIIKMQQEFEEEKRILQQKLTEINGQVKSDVSFEKAEENEVEVAELRSEITKLEAELKEKEAHAASLSESLQASEKEHADALEAQESKISGLNSQIKDSMSKIAGLESELNEHKENGKRESGSEEKDPKDQVKKEVQQDLETQIEEQRRLIDALNAELDALRVEIKEATNENSQADSHDAPDFDDELSQLRNELSKLRDELSEKAAALQTEERKIKSLQAELELEKSQNKSDHDSNKLQPVSAVTQTESLDTGESAIANGKHSEQEDSQLRAEYENCKAELAQERLTNENLGHDLTDLLSLWESQEKKLAKYKLRLKALDIDVSDESDNE